MAVALHLTLQEDDIRSLSRQVYEQLRDQILVGELPAGSRLPPSRRLARDHGLARVTVSAAYEQLKAEGYVIARVGAGTFVATDLPAKRALIEESEDELVPRLSHWGERVLGVRHHMPSEISPTRPDIDFGFGRSFPHIFPYDIWRRLLARYLSTDDTMLSRYGSAAGFEPLRQAVSDYVGRLRGVRCTADQVVIVSGMQQALDILARLLLNQGDEVLVETPGYADAFDLFLTFGARLRPLAVDDHGFPVEEIPSSSKARFAFVTPSNQFPRGGAMPLGRRLALLQWAKANDALILEDDYDGELRYSGHPLAALQGLDRGGRVVYLGTFSKVLFPALRLGYVVLPPALLSPFLQAKELVDRGAPTLTQAAVADFIAEGHFERHLRRLRREYGQRRATLVHALEEHLGGEVRYSAVEAGLHVMLRLSPEYEEQRLVRDLAASGVGVYPGTPYHIDQPIEPSILLGFSGLSEEQIKAGIERLAAVIHRQHRTVSSGNAM